MLNISVFITNKKIEKCPFKNCPQKGQMKGKENE